SSLEGTMARRSIGVLFAVATLVGAVLPVFSQGRGQSGARGGGPLPEGAGRELVQAQCTKCHAVNLIANSGGYSRQGWEELFGTMVALPKDQKREVAAYLAKNFPEQPRPSPVVLPGSVTVSIKEWIVPTLGSRPHDPEPGPDGSIWWTGMF